MQKAFNLIMEALKIAVFTNRWHERKEEMERDGEIYASGDL